MNVKEINPDISLNRLNPNNSIKCNKIQKIKFLETNFKEIAIAQFFDEKLIKENIQIYEEKFEMIKNHMNLLIRQIDYFLFKNIQSNNIVRKDVLKNQKLNFDNLKSLMKDMIRISSVLSSLNQVWCFFFLLFSFYYIFNLKGKLFGRIGQNLYLLYTRIK